jgi:hypothetical protein
MRLTLVLRGLTLVLRDLTHGWVFDQAKDVSEHD